MSSVAARYTARDRRVSATIVPISSWEVEISVHIVPGLSILTDLDIVHGLVTIHTSLSASRRRWIALVVVCLGQLMMVVDATIVNVALPSIQHDLHFSQANLTWVVNAYLIAFGSFLLLAGRLGDLVGRKKGFLIGLGIFTLSSP